MPFRRLPDTDATRGKALDAALKKSTATHESAHLISAGTAAALQTFCPQWQKETTDRADALGRQTAATSALDAAGQRLRTCASHFFQVFQLGVARGIYSPSGRAVFELSVNEETIPNLTTEADLLQWTDRIVKGDPRRVANFSELVMANPSAADVAAALTIYFKIHTHHATHSSPRVFLRALRISAFRSHLPSPYLFPIKSVQIPAIRG